MAVLTEEQLDTECLEYQTGLLSGYLMAYRTEPELLVRVGTHYALVLAQLGRNRSAEYKYIHTLASAGQLYIGRAAHRAWQSRPLLDRIFAGAGTRRLWEQAYTESLFMEADGNLRRIADDTAAFRTAISGDPDPSSS